MLDRPFDPETKIISREDGPAIIERDCNICIASHCINADSTASSSAKVIGPCIAMGVAVAHALTLAGSGSVHQIDQDALRKRIAANLEG